MDQTDVELSAEEAALIATGMKRVARADGAVHQRELALINAFAKEIPEDVGMASALGEAARDAYLRSLILVALADGRISDEEYAEICALMQEQSVDARMIDARIVAVKKEFLQQFEGVKFFKEAVDEVAASLGL